MDQQRQSEILRFDQKFAAGIRRRFSRMGLALTAMIVSGNLVSALIHLLVSELAPHLVDTDWYMWTLSSVSMYLIAVPIMLMVAGRDKTAAAPEKHKLQAGHWMILLLMCFGLMQVGNYVANYLMLMVAGIKGEPVENTIATMLQGSALWINAIVTVLLAPIIEELIFRKLMIDRLGGFGEKTAMIFSALMFGLFHANLYQFFYAFLLGMLFAYVYIRTGKIGYTIGFHMVINFFGGVVAPLILRLLDQERLMAFVEKMSDAAFVEKLAGDPAAHAEFMEQFAPMLPGLFAYAAYAMALMVVSVTGVVLFVAHRRKMIMKPAPFQLPRERVGNTVYFNPGVISAILVCTLLMVYMLVA